MTFSIAAAGTGGHVFPGLAVGEALVTAGVRRSDILFVGGTRLERTVYPDAGFPFLEVELRGLSRSLDPKNLGIPGVVVRAMGRMTSEFRARAVGVVLGMGGYVTIPAALAARRAGAGLMVSEQNAHAGLANRLAGRIASRRFGSFPTTEGLAGAEWVGNPVRREIASFDRAALRDEALSRYGLSGDSPVIGVFGGSLGARAINDAVTATLSDWESPPVSVVHLAGTEHLGDVSAAAASANLQWRVVGFEERMDLFYAVSDLVIARAGGAVAELTATGTPAILVPGAFGSSGHQDANARALAEVGAATIVEQDRLGDLGATIRAIVSDHAALERMRQGASRLAKPDAADVIARAMMESHG